MQDENRRTADFAAMTRTMRSTVPKPLADGGELDLYGR